jgi:hypothetical protein
MGFSGAGATAVSLCNKKYLAEQRGEVSIAKVLLESDKRHIQMLKRRFTDS